ncbi:MAG: ATP-dependent DNA helicase RecG, partial [Ruminococcaceae bacterium]|nr:ATP-dependent DNA helicase RecG [Oscillospiraceae bacterium]
MVTLSAGVETLSGIGPKKKEQLASVGIHTVRDALFYVPLRYEDRRERKDIAALTDGEKAGVVAVATGKMNVRRSGGKTLYTQTFRDGTGSLRVTWQNTPYLTKAFVHGAAYALYGRVSVKGNLRQMFSPLQQPAGKRGGQIGSIVPVYPAGAGVSQSLISSAIAASLPALGEEMEDLLPAVVRQSAGVPDIRRSLYALHRPDTMEEAAAAMDRLKFEELFLLFLGMRLQRKSLEHRQGYVLSCNMEPFYKNLPFTLTDGQKKAVEDICRDMAGGRPMNRLGEGGGG